MRFELCVDSIDGVRIAREGGADRVELRAGDGLTPSLGTIRQARAVGAIGLHVAIRPRTGDFVYSDEELAVMELDIAAARAEGADGVSFGALTFDGAIDIAKTGRLVAAARPMAVTFNRAFDLTADPAAALDGVIGLELDRVLTSGGAKNPIDGLPAIADLNRRADGRIIVIAAGAINPGNVLRIVRQSRVREIQFSADETLDARKKPPRHGAGAGRHAPSLVTIRAVIDRAQSA